MGQPSLYNTVCAGRRGQFPGVEVEGCSLVICLFEGGHRLTQAELKSSAEDKGSEFACQFACRWISHVHLTRIM